MSIEEPTPTTAESEPTVDPETLYYERSVVTEGNSARIARAMKKAKSGQPLTIGVIGGSITVGYWPPVRYMGFIARIEICSIRSRTWSSSNSA
jgi:hypothetical protein